MQNGARPGDGEGDGSSLGSAFPLPPAAVALPPLPPGPRRPRRRAAPFRLAPRRAAVAPLTRELAELEGDVAATQGRLAELEGANERLQTRVAHLSDEVRTLDTLFGLASAEDRDPGGGEPDADAAAGLVDLPPPRGAPPPFAARRLVSTPTAPIARRVGGPLRNFAIGDTVPAFSSALASAHARQMSALAAGARAAAAGRRPPVQQQQHQQQHGQQQTAPGPPRPSAHTGTGRPLQIDEPTTSAPHLDDHDAFPSSEMFRASAFGLLAPNAPDAGVALGRLVAERGSCQLGARPLEATIAVFRDLANRSAVKLRRLALFEEDVASGAATAQEEEARPREGVARAAAPVPERGGDAESLSASEAAASVNEEINGIAIDCAALPATLLKHHPQVVSFFSSFSSFFFFFSSFFQSHVSHSFTPIHRFKQTNKQTNTPDRRAHQEAPGRR
jgi:hypothetical protein